MKIGMNLLLWTAGASEEHRPVIESLKAMGYDGVELPIMGGTVDDFAKVGAMLDEVGLERTGAMAFGDPNTNPVSDDAALRGKALDHMKWLVDCAQAAGVTHVIGPMTQVLGKFSGTGPTEVETQRVVDMLSEMGPYAADAGVTLVIEPINRFECYMCNTLARGAALAGLVNHPNVGMMADTFHMHIEEKDPLAAIRENAAAIRHVHFSENDRSTPGAGQIDFAATYKTLVEVGYDGWIVVEAFGSALPEIASATCIWRKMYDSEEQLARDALATIRSCQ